MPKLIKAFINWVRSRSRGQGLVETAVVLPVLLFMMIGAVEVGWVLRTYLVLQNGNREGTRFAARGKYMDFTLRNFTNVASELSVSGCNGIADIHQPQCWNIIPQTIGYTYVLSSVLSSISAQVPIHVTDADPNGTIIISYFLVDTGNPFSSPHIIRSSGFTYDSCANPASRGTDYTADDRILYPGMANYSFLTWTYGITSTTTRLDFSALATQFKEENDAFNCQLFYRMEDGRDGTIDNHISRTNSEVDDDAKTFTWSQNRVIASEIFYDNPQVLGVPIISNYLTDPIPVYVKTLMRITGDAESEGCEVYPIALNTATLSGKSPGDSLENIRNGTGTGNFGWLAWNPSQSDAVYLASELRQPNMAISDYTDPGQAGDHVLNAGDSAAGLTGNVNDTEVRDALDDLKGKQIRVPVWDTASSSGTNVSYHIVKFIIIQVSSYDLTGNPKTISATYIGEDPLACPGNGM